MHKRSIIVLGGLLCLLALCHGCQEDGPDERLMREAPLVLWQDWSMSHHPVVAMHELSEVRRTVGSEWADIDIGLRRGSYAMNAENLCTLGYWEEAAGQFTELHKLGGLMPGREQAWLMYTASMSHSQDLQGRTVILLAKAECPGLAECGRAFSKGDLESLSRAIDGLEAESSEVQIMQLLRAELLLLQGEPRRAWRSLDVEDRDRFAGMPISRDMYPFFLYRAALIAHAAGEEESALELAEMVLGFRWREYGSGVIVPELLFRRVTPLARFLDRQVSQAEQKTGVEQIGITE